MTLGRAFLTRPFAHRGFHNKDGRPENSRVAFRAAIEAGYGIELDLQCSADGVAMVFHDDHLKRLTGVTGLVRERTAEELTKIALLGGDECIPTLVEVLELVSGAVPLLIETKDQDGGLEENLTQLEEATAHALKGYKGEAALMSFNPHSVAKMAKLVPERPRGLVTCRFDEEDWPTVRADVRERLATIPDYSRTGSSFISHEVIDLQSARVAELKSGGAHVLTWTVRSPEQEAEARLVADNITFEGYDAAHELDRT